MTPKLDLEARMTIKKLGERGVPNTEIATILGVTEGAVRYHLRRQAEGQTDGRARQQPRAAAHHDSIVSWLSAKQEPNAAINISDLHRWLKEEKGYDGSLRSVERYFAKTFPRPRRRARRRVETPPGAQVQLDWAEHRGVMLAGQAETLYSFHARLSHCRFEAAVWSKRKNLLSWLHCHNEGFRRLGGVAATARIDNEKTAVVEGAGPWGRIHPSYQRYALTMRFHIDACLPRSPQHKGKVERGIRDFRRTVGVYRRHWNDLQELQQVTDEILLESAARRICPATGKTVLASWEDEKEILAPLPILPEPFDHVATRRVGSDCMISFEGCQYSVPFRLVGFQVEIRGCAGKVQILRDCEIVAEHERASAARIIIDPEHFEGPSTEEVLAPMPLGRMGTRLAEIAAMVPEQRPLDLYAALAEVAR